MTKRMENLAEFLSLSPVDNSAIAQWLWNRYEEWFLKVKMYNLPSISVPSEEEKQKKA